MDMQINNVIEVLLGSDNERRAKAEKFIDQITETTFDQGIDDFILSMSHENPQVNFQLLRCPPWELFF